MTVKTGNVESLKENGQEQKDANLSIVDWKNSKTSDRKKNTTEKKT